ncbi:MAG TPA: protein translocase subunit SecF [Candidatus Paceibacterota bacterium]|jgi:preprotein translocase subunit SecF|nr:protein translocase subunit SecF [Candidatus Paceibacterota bacterium]
MFIIRHRYWFFGLTAIIVLLSIISLVVYGLHESIDFTGGTLVDVTYPAGLPDAATLQASLNSAGFSGYSLREVGTNDYDLRSGNLTDTQRSDLTQILSVNGRYPATVVSLNEIGPTIGAQLKTDSIEAIALVLLCILLFIAFAFRKVSKPISSWMYGLMAIVGLCHNVLVTTGFFALLGHLTGAQVDTLFVTAILTVLGFSVHDTIVVFDRVRENLRINQEKGRREDFAETAGRALGQTFTRSVNTSLTVLLTLLALYILGPASTKVFSLTLLVGIIAGTYSSIFLATPLLVVIEARRRKK